jgi:hypothetical protein
MSTTTSDTEVEGSIVHVIHTTYNDTDSTYERTVLALATKDDLSLAVDEDDEDIALAAERRTRRYRTRNTIDLEVASVIDVDMEAAEAVGIVDADGKLDFTKANRRIDSSDDEYIEIAYFSDESTDIVDAELVHRFEDLELTSPEIDPSATPPLLSWTWWVEGTVHLSYDPSQE